RTCVANEPSFSPKAAKWRAARPGGDTGCFALIHQIGDCLALRSEPWRRGVERGDEVNAIPAAPIDQSVGCMGIRLPESGRPGPQLDRMVGIEFNCCVEFPCRLENYDPPRHHNARDSAEA